MPAKMTNPEVNHPCIGKRPHWPELSLSGQPYDRTQSTVGLGGDYFVVLDRFLSPAARDSLLVELLTVVSGGVKPDELA